jgi:putative adhesin
VYIAPNASLTLYVGGMGSISGGGVVNGSGLPSKFSYNGLPSSTSLFYSGQGDFVGTINAPEASVRISGGSSVFGAVICNTFTSSGGSGVHYDQALRGGGIFMVTGWTEL